MAKIMDKNTSKPKMANKTFVWVWEVTTYEWNESIDEEVEEIKAIFFDPWKAVEYAIKTYGVASGVKASMYHINNCK